MDCKFNIGDYVYYRGNKPSDIYLVIGRTEYSRKKTIYCGKDRLVHEPTYELINIFYVKDRAIKEITDTYGIPMFSNCREHHMTLKKESRSEDIHTIPFKFNLNDYVTLKNGSVSYKITSRTEWLDGGNPTYELMRITESEHVYFEYYSEELINEKICVKEVMDKRPPYICDPEKNVSCSKEECYISGGTCSHTFNKAYEKKQTNQDKLAEMVRTMKPEYLAEYLSNDIFVCEQNCPIEDKYGYDRCPEGVTCEEAIIKWLKEDAE